MMKQTASRLVPLTALRDGDRGRLNTAGLCCDDCDLLNALGLTDQCNLRVCRAGEPCIIQVHATRVGIAVALASKIMVHPERA
jgi:Fe2+ transport system protein FeoA